MADPDPRAEMLRQRYGTYRPRRRIAGIVAIVLVAGAGLGWLAWAAVFHANPAVDADVASFDVRGTHRIDATVQIRVRDHASAGSCLLRASAEDHSVVGERSFQVSGATVQPSATYRVRTERLATTVEVVSCTPDHR